MSTPTTIANLSKEEQEALKASVFQRLHPRVYLERFLAENVRPDGRELDAWRPVSVNVGSISTADGSALVRLGDTTVVCGVKAEIAEPELDKPQEGFIVPNLDLPAMCSPKYKPGPPTEEAQVLSDKLNEVIVTSGLVPLSSLCIHPSKSAWVLYVDATCINYDGNVFDATLIAMVAALRNTQLPEARYEELEEGLGRTICSRKSRKPLSIARSPIAMSFGIFDSTRILSDPTAFEEPLLDTTLSIVIGDNDDLISVSQLGLGLGLDSAGSHGQDDALLACISAAKKRRAELAKYIYNT